jgi:NAD(P)-dependent dehydrogenase (short-subunit alcohol dehydrogenase family)
MDTLERQRAVVTGGSRGFGLGIVEALVDRKAEVTVVARDPKRLSDVKGRLGVGIVAGDVTDPSLAERVLREVRPTVLVLNAGVTPLMAPLHEQSWESFSAVWENDVKQGFHWVKAALRQPLDRGSRVLIGSSGAAIQGSPMSGGYAGAKRMLWLLAHYANGVSGEIDLGLRFQALVPQQISGDTELGRSAAEGYARQQGVSVEEFLRAFGKPLPPRQIGEHVVSILTDPRYEGVVAFGLKGETGIQSLDG